MTLTSATVACIFDKDLISSMKKEQCYADTKFCYMVKDINMWYHVLCSRSNLEKVDNMNSAAATMALGSYSKRLPDESNAAGELHFKATIEDLFASGYIVLGTKYNKGTNKRTQSFNGYVRELRIWSKEIEVEYARYIERERLDPMTHRALVGYWPLFDGTLNNLIEQSNTNEVSYNGGASEWTKGIDLPNFPYCYKGYKYHPKTSSCTLRQNHIALYLNRTDACACSIPKLSKKVSGEGITLSIWIYLREQADEAVFIGIDEIAGIKCSSGRLGGYLNEVQVVPIVPSNDYLLPTARWTHYAFVASKDLEKAYLFFDGRMLSDSISGDLAVIGGDFIIGKGIIGFIREAKIWASSLITNIDSTVDYTLLMQEKYQYTFYLTLVI
jgi:hypothetical protein